MGSHIDSCFTAPRKLIYTSYTLIPLSTFTWYFVLCTNVCVHSLTHSFTEVCFPGLYTTILLSFPVLILHVHTRYTQYATLKLKTDSAEKFWESLIKRLFFFKKEWFIICGSCPVVLVFLRFENVYVGCRGTVLIYILMCFYMSKWRPEIVRYLHLIETGVHQFSWPASASSALVLQVCAAVLCFFWGCWGSKLRSWGLSSQHNYQLSLLPSPVVCEQSNRVLSAQKIIRRNITVVQPLTFPNSFISCSHVENLN